LSLSDEQVADFISDGFVKLDRAFPPALAATCRSILWADMPEGADDPASWTRPVVRLGMYGHALFVEAANTPALHQAFDQLVGKDKWLPPRAMGTFPIRFPSADEPGDTGWHVDMSFDYQKPDFLDWRVNIASAGRALLMLFLFSDVAEDDAPTRIRVGSHKHVARVLAPAGEAGLTLRTLLPHFAETEGLPERIATGEAGTVYLCHPFLVHASQRHRGHQPRFLAQPPLLPRAPLNLEADENTLSPVARAIRVALDRRA
jgi:hypothetical protein